MTIKNLKQETGRFIVGGIRVFSPMLANKILFFRLFKRPADLKNPQTYSEKIMVRMNSSAYEKLSEYADKWKVREYVAGTIGEEYLIPLLDVYDSPKDVRYERIPENAYIKLNHGSGYNIIYQKKNELRIRRKIRKWFREDYAKKTLERQYTYIPRKILVEENLVPDGQVLWEFSFFTFHGDVEFVQVRDNFAHRFEVGKNYEKLPFQMFSTVSEIAPKVAEYDRMVQLAQKLAEPFDFVRVDFFLAGHRIYFGELTFSPGGGIRIFKPYEYNLTFGEKLEIL